MSNTNKRSGEEPFKSTASEKTKELETVAGFDDLNFELSSGKSDETSEAVSEREMNSPSIDDFVITKQKEKIPSDDNADQWFMNILGQEMGPFPFEEVVSMVLREEVGSKDLLRNGANREWIVAGEIAGLFPEVEVDVEDDFDLRSGAEFQEVNHEAAPPGGTDIQVVGGEINHILAEAQEKKVAVMAAAAKMAAEAKREKVQLPEIITEPKSKSEQTPPAAEETEPVPVAPTKQESEEKQKQEIADRLDTWLGDEVPPVEKEENEEEDVAETPMRSQATPATWEAQAPAAMKPAPLKIKTVKEPREKMDFSGLTKLLDLKAMIAIGVVVLAIGFMFMPSIDFGGSAQDKETHQRFQQIYSQIQRARKTNPGQLATLEKEVVPELEEIANGLLKAGAGAQKPAKQKLMFSAKFCLIPMLQEKILEPNELDDQFKGYQEEAAKILRK